jgi:hypothetical protein
MTKTTRQTVRVNGKRVVLTTRNGKVNAKAAAPKEWELQAAQVKRLRSMPEYGKRFLLAGDQNAAKRGPRAQAEAIAAGMTPGEPDVRIYLASGRLGLIENKVGRAPLTESQRERHPALARLGHHVEVVRAATEAEAADKAEALVRGWLADPVAVNDNKISENDFSRLTA